MMIFKVFPRSLAHPESQSGVSANQTTWIDEKMELLVLARQQANRKTLQQTQTPSYLFVSQRAMHWDWPKECLLSDHSIVPSIPYRHYP
jgi:hypothetical protein